MEEIEFAMHILAAIVSIAVVVMLFPIIRQSLELKSGLVYELSWSLILPAICIAVFSTMYAAKEGFYAHEEFWEYVEIIAEVFVILASISILLLGLKIRNYMKKLEA
jgi:hypothetical protein